MKKLQSFFSKDTYDQIFRRFTNLSKFTPIQVEVLEVDKGKREIILEVFQYEKRTDDVYTTKELHDFIRPFASIMEDEGWTVHIRPKVYKGDGIDSISAEWVHRQLDKHGMSQSKLAKELGVDRFVISKLLKNSTGFTRWHKAAFYFFFKSLLKPSAESTDNKSTVVYNLIWKSSIDGFIRNKVLYRIPFDYNVPDVGETIVINEDEFSDEYSFESIVVHIDYGLESGDINVILQSKNKLDDSRVKSGKVLEDYKMQ